MFPRTLAPSFSTNHPVVQESIETNTRCKSSFENIVNQSQDAAYPLKVTHSSATEINSLFSELLKDKLENGKPVAFVSGGSLFGFAAALKLKKQGFNVVVIESRPEYKRKNVIELKEDVIYSLANLAGSGDLVRYLLDCNLITPHERRIVQDGKTHVGSMQESKRFFHWVSHQNCVPVKINAKCRNENIETQTRHLDLAIDTTLDQSELRDKLDYLDLEYGKMEKAVQGAPKDWTHHDFGRISPDNLGLAQIKDLEAGLNAYCVAKAGIYVVRGKTSLDTDPQDTSVYRPRVSLGEEHGFETVSPDFVSDLIVLAEGASSENAALISGKKLPAQVSTVERIYNRSYRIPPHQTAGFSSITYDMENEAEKQIISVVCANRPKESLVSVSVWDTQGEKDLSSSEADETKKDADNHYATVEDRLFERASPLIQSVLVEGGLAKSALKGAPYTSSGKIDVRLKRADVPIKGNVVIGGDTAAAGSPIGGLGGSLALTAYPTLIGQLVTHPDFGSKDEKKRSNLEKFFINGINQITDFRHRVPRSVMSRFKYYSPETVKSEVHLSAMKISESMPDLQKLNVADA